ncbi:MAG TPA: glutaredoxin family protein [Accumulibacter sp.]|uniref:glutaredoxin family protein n=1 Tax=Accumulibacter sp. TaxID=2053492 RepID=UPI002CE3D2E9|nr:glutaredoxin family protein [Accumulibacter sp.]HNJ50494.1 glutaredoxin family protein [Accumulibacter sp.]
MSGRPQLTLVSRSYCHLCAEMEVALGALAEELQFAVEMVDVDADPRLLAHYDEWVPVLLHGQTELCHYRLEVSKVRDYLSRIG